MIYPHAVQRAGPGWKQGYPPIYKNSCRGVVCHSMVGQYTGAMARLDSGDRASWHFSVTKGGQVYQHYDTEAITWHAGTPQWNQRLIGIEHEGGGPGNESEPLTVAQRDASVALVHWLAQQHGFPLVRRVGLWEHNELSQTACPSSRIPWRYYEEQEDMAERVWCAERLQTWIVGKGGAAPVLTPEADKVYQAIYGPHTKVMTGAELDALKVK